MKTPGKSPAKMGTPGKSPASQKTPMGARSEQKKTPAKYTPSSKGSGGGGDSFGGDDGGMPNVHSSNEASDGNVTSRESARKHARKRVEPDSDEAAKGVAAREGKPAKELKSSKNEDEDEEEAEEEDDDEEDEEDEEEEDEDEDEEEEAEEDKDEDEDEDEEGDEEEEEEQEDTEEEEGVTLFSSTFRSRKRTDANSGGEQQHALTDIESPPPSSHVCMSIQHDGTGKS
jgi:hypothetical protein